MLLDEVTHATEGAVSMEQIDRVLTDIDVLRDTPLFEALSLVSDRLRTNQHRMKSLSVQVIQIVDQLLVFLPCLIILQHL